MEKGHELGSEPSVSVEPQYLLLLLLLQEVGMNNYEKLARYRDEIDSMMRNYQSPTNIFNVGNQVEFEAKFISKDDKPSEIMVQRKTAFISLENALLTIKEVNGDIKEYEIVIPKTPEQIENEELKAKIKELEEKLERKE